MILQPVGADDDRLAACQRAYFAEISERFGVSFDPHAGESEKHDHARQWHVLALEPVEAEDPSTIGCGSLRDLGDGICEVKRVWVSDAARGRGVATALMNWLENRATKEGFTILRLDTNKALFEARKLYLQRGYNEIGRYNANPFADHFFEKRLAAS